MVYDFNVNETKWKWAKLKTILWFDFLQFPGCRKLRKLWKFMKQKKILWFIFQHFVHYPCKTDTRIFYGTFLYAAPHTISIYALHCTALLLFPIISFGFFTLFLQISLLELRGMLNIFRQTKNHKPYFYK